MHLHLHILNYVLLPPASLLIEEEGEVDHGGEPGVGAVHDVVVPEPREVEGEVDGAADGDGAEEVVEDVALLAGEHQPELALLEAVNLWGRVNFYFTDCAVSIFGRAQ